MHRWIRDTSLVLRRAFAEAREDDVTMVAQALAYSLFLAIPSAMLVALGVFSLVADASTVEAIIDRARQVMPEEAATLLRDSLRRSTQSTGSGLVLTIVGFVLAIWTTTSAATTLMKGITLAFDGTESRGFVHRRLLAGVIVAALVLAIALVLGLRVLGPHLERWIGGVVGAPTLTAWLWWTLQWPLLVGGLLFAFAVVLYLGPDANRRPGWRLISPGAVTALVVWVAVSAGFGLLQCEVRVVRQDMGCACRRRRHARLALAHERRHPVRCGGERRGKADRDGTRIRVIGLTNTAAPPTATFRTRTIRASGQRTKLNGRSSAMDTDRIEGKSKEIEGETQQKWGEAKDKARDAWEDVKDEVEDVIDGAEDRVDELDEKDDNRTASASR